MKKKILILGALLATAAMQGCMVGPDFHPPKQDSPAGWNEVSNTRAPSTQPDRSVPTSQAPEVAHWWTSFNDPTLNSLIQRAIASNLDLKVAEARIRQARATRGVVGAAILPTLNADGSYTRARTQGANGPWDGSHDLYQAKLDASWEIDIFGGRRRDIEAAEADIQAAVEDRRDVLVTLTSEVAIDYFALRGAQKELAVARRNLKTQQESLGVTTKRQSAGYVSTLDVANAQAQVASTESAIPSFEVVAKQNIYALGVLLGKQPESLVAELSPEALIPGTPPEVPIGLPSDLLRRRPDIRAAEARIHAATARIGVATADLFPKFSLTGSLGVAGNNAEAFGDISRRFWSVGPSVSWPIFAGGSIAANIEFQNAVEQQALFTYRNTVLIAFRDVETALVAYDKDQIRRTALTRAVNANRRAVDLANQLYREGKTNFLDVLNAQRSLLLSEDQLVQSNVDVATNLISLYKALGGGWESELQPAPSTQPTQPAPADHSTARASR